MLLCDIVKLGSPIVRGQPPPSPTRKCVSFIFIV